MRQHLNINSICIPTKTQQHTLKHSNENTTALYTYIKRQYFVAASFALIRSAFLLGIELLSSSMTFDAFQIFVSSLFYIAFDYQSLSSLYFKYTLRDSCLANFLVILEWVFFYILEMFSTFRVLAWREIIDNISLLWEQNAFMSFQCHEKYHMIFVLPTYHSFFSEETGPCC